MKKSPILLLGVVLLAGACAPVVVGPAGPPAGFVVAVEDRPYYSHGPYYVVGGQRRVWVNGHWTRRHGHRIWVHGHYVVRG